MNHVISWEQVLSVLSAQIDAVEVSLDAGESPEAGALAFAPPVGLGPLPENLREHALEVLQKQADLQTRLDNVIATVGRDLGATTRASNASGRTSPFADSTTPRFFDSAI